MTIQIGQPAPNFQADAWVRGAHGPRKVTLSEYRGKWVVLFFYPRDFTFICPTEIASFGALQPSFEREDAVVIGASTDSFFTHKAWFESDPRLQGIDFPVLEKPRYGHYRTLANGVDQTESDHRLFS